MNFCQASYQQYAYNTTHYTYHEHNSYQTSSGYQNNPQFEKLKSKVRIIQDNLVFVSGIPSQLSNIDLLKSNQYFGRYGIVQKIIINPMYPGKKNSHFQGYVTYSNKIDASLAIVALDNLKVFERTLKVSYGTTKYCINFLRGMQCPNYDCFYLHNLEEQRELLSWDSKQIFKRQVKYAFQQIQQNIYSIVYKMYQNQSQIWEGFPSIHQVMNKIVQKNIVSEQAVTKIKEQIENNHRSLQRVFKNSISLFDDQMYEQKYPTLQKNSLGSEYQYIDCLSRKTTAEDSDNDDSNLLKLCDQYLIERVQTQPNEDESEEQCQSALKLICNKLKKIRVQSRLSFVCQNKASQYELHNIIMHNIINISS